MKVTVLEQVNIGYRILKFGTVEDVYDVIGKSWINAGLAALGEVDVEDLAKQKEEVAVVVAEDDEPEDNSDRDYEIEAEVTGEVDDDQSIDDRALELMEAHTVEELKVIHETIIGKKPHWKANEETIAKAIAEAEIA